VIEVFEISGNAAIKVVMEMLVGVAESVQYVASTSLPGK
jgi:hypothetical protein